ncbi:beta transducin [Podospora conica]|nr:beta transducin [Schizothecium conicum]
MRLLNTSTLELHYALSATGTGRRPYAILSHTWEDEEILFDDVKNGPQAIPRHKKGFSKVEGSARYAKEQGLDWIWIDTCCIDKSSSAELSEAINSMFIWYHSARVCFAYLSDVKSPEELASSRWFKRGWTLQELIAPREVEILDSQWQLMGDRTGMANTLSSITGIDELLLAGHYTIDAYSVSTRMGWASRRETGREEDMAYSLLGIFQVNLPLLYGEGLTRAFFRLQEEILKTSSDQSIFAFRRFLEGPSSNLLRNMARHLAISPTQFQQDDTIINDDPYERSYAALHPITLHPHGVTFRALIGPATYHLNKQTSINTQLVILNCCFQSDPLARPAFLVANLDGLLVRVSTPVLRAVQVPVPGEGSVSAIEVGINHPEGHQAWLEQMNLRGERCSPGHSFSLESRLTP